MKNDRVPKNDEKRPILLRVPSPKPSPRLVRPNSPQNRPDKTEQEAEANHSIGHGNQRAGGLGIARRIKNLLKDIEVGQGSGQESGAVSDGDGYDMSGQPKIGVQDRA